MNNLKEYYRSECKKLFHCICWLRITSFCFCILSVFCFFYITAHEGYGDDNTSIFIAALKGGWLLLSSVTLACSLFKPNEYKPLNDVLRMSDDVLTFYFWFYSGWLIWWNKFLAKSLLVSSFTALALALLTNELVL